MEAEKETLTVGQRCGRFCSFHWQGIVIFLTPILLSPLLTLHPTRAFHCAFVVCLMATFWVTEALPLGVTALIPIALFPGMGIMDSQTICLCYFRDSSMLFVGGLIVALTIEFSNLHKRVAYFVIMLVGCSPRRLHFALVMVTMFVSMWINNSAAAAMMCPVIKAVLEELAANNMAKVIDEKRVPDPDEPPYASKIAHCYYLGVAFSSSLGGLGTLIGTGTNVVYKGLYEERFSDTTATNFTNFSLFTIPIVIITTLLVYVEFEWLYLGLFRPNSEEAQEVQKANEGRAIAEEIVLQKKNELGPLTTHEVQVSLLFLLMVFLFVSRDPGFTQGWGNVLNEVKIKTSFTVILMVLLYFLLPIHYYFMKYCICRRPKTEGPHGSLMTWRFLHDNMPWGLIILIGGGFTLSTSMKDTGLAKLLGNALKVMGSLPPPMLQFFCIAFAIFLTSFSSNMAVCNIVMPVLCEMAVVVRVHPAYLALPSAMALSYAFAFPVSTPPNAIIAGYANIRTKDMFLAGIGPMIISLFVTFFFAQTWGYIVIPDMDTFPDWATGNETSS